jgi:hypothetical protein
MLENKARVKKMSQICDRGHIFLLPPGFLSANNSGAPLIVHTYGTHAQKRAACMFVHKSVPQRLLAAGLACSPRPKAPS